MHGNETRVQPKCMMTTLQYPFFHFNRNHERGTIVVEREKMECLAYRRMADQLLGILWKLLLFTTWRSFSGIQSPKHILQRHKANTENLQHECPRIGSMVPQTTVGGWSTTRTTGTLQESGEQSHTAWWHHFWSGVQFLVGICKDILSLLLQVPSVCAASAMLTTDVAGHRRTFVKEEHRSSTIKASFSKLYLIGTFILLVNSINATDLRNSIQNEGESCFKYTPSKNLFELNCTLLDWQKANYGNHHHITLKANETFDGNDNEIDLASFNDFRGLFVVDDSGVSSLERAPLIRNVDVKNGETNTDGGFIVQSNQRFFIVDSCSSTGVIDLRGGGICGRRCGEDMGHILITGCQSTGKIKGRGAGGIAGHRIAEYWGSARIVDCHSIGDIEGGDAGGIVGGLVATIGATADIIDCSSTGKLLGIGVGGITGDHAAKDEGTVNISGCYSVGDIQGDDSGGIVGDSAGDRDGIVTIQQCLSEGVISGRQAGGITGTMAGGDTGDVEIQKCRSTGEITGHRAGGIAGALVGDNGNAEIRQCHSTGEITGSNAGGITGSWAGHDHGHTKLEQCYSLGNVDGADSGGICGWRTAEDGAKVEISDCYSRGMISGSHAGGICGDEVGKDDEFGGGELFITNSYASGSIAAGAGGLLGGIDPDAIVEVKYSVYNGRGGPDDLVGGGGGRSVVSGTGNSDNLEDIEGQLYLQGGNNQWSNDTWVVRGNNELPTLRFQSHDTFTPSPSMSATVLGTVSSSVSATPTASRSPSPTVTATESATSSSTASQKETHTSSETPTSSSSSPRSTATSSPSMREVFEIPRNSSSTQKEHPMSPGNRATRLIQSLPLVRCDQHS
eukprot:gb/GECG01011845.1/.p1 GENE.gb/GECG01011845.1/~~gb/GECG01011845.1/.p1  ORF type:complete len:847 (+),score=109.40 gb/GECG01011845.1/:1-2541(+)